MKYFEINYFLTLWRRVWETPLASTHHMSWGAAATLCHRALPKLVRLLPANAPLCSWLPGSPIARKLPEPVRSPQLTSDTHAALRHLAKATGFAFQLHLLLAAARPSAAGSNGTGGAFPAPDCAHAVVGPFEVQALVSSSTCPHSILTRLSGRPGPALQGRIRHIGAVMALEVSHQ